MIIHETVEPIFFRSLCFDKIKNNIYCIYGKEAKFNTLSDSIDTFNFDKVIKYILYIEYIYKNVKR